MPASLVDLFEEYGFRTQKKTATEWSAPCPCCGGKDRCSIWPDEADGRGYYWCRQCDAKGDGIQFLRDFGNMSYRDACQRIGVAPVEHLKTPSLPKHKKMDRFEAAEEENKAAVDTPVWRKRAADFVAWASDQLQKSPDQLAWLEARGISASAAREYQLGFNPGEKGKNCIIRPRNIWGLPPVMKNGKEKRFWLPRGIVIPQIEDGEVRRIRIRRLDADRQEFRPEHKYHVVEGSEMDMLWLPCTRDSKVAVVVESELDAFMLHSLAGDLAHCVSSMTSNVRKLSPSLLARFEASLCILVALDSDQAGAAGWPRWHETFPRAKRWPVPAGKDPGEAFSCGENLRLWLEAGIPEGLRMTMSAGDRLALEEEEEKPMAAEEKEHEEESPTLSHGNVPPEVLQFAEVWKKTPITYRRILDISGIPQGWTWECNAAWSANHMAEKHAFLKLAEQAEVQRWISMNPLTRITGATFLDWESASLNMCSTCAFSRVKGGTRPVHLKPCKGCVYNPTDYRWEGDLGDHYHETGVHYEN